MKAGPKRNILLMLFLVIGVIVFAGCGEKAEKAAVPAPAAAASEKAAVPQAAPPPEKAADPQAAATVGKEVVKEEAVINGDFEKGIDGWVLAGGRIKTANSGDKYLSAGFDWQNYQILDLKPNTSYLFNASTRQGVGEQEARFKIIFFDSHGQRIGYYNILYHHKGRDWESIPSQKIDVPDKTAETLLYVLSEGEKDVHDFDKISLIKESVSKAPVPAKIIMTMLNVSPERIINSGFDSGTGWSGLETRIEKEADGNRYLVNGYNWDVTQRFSVHPNTEYQLTARTKKNTSSGPARFSLIFFDDQGQRLQAGYNFDYRHQGDGWETISPQQILTPSKAEKALLYLLSDNRGDGTHCFDDVSFTAVPEKKAE